MTSDLFIFLILVLLQTQLLKSQNMYCQEAVDSVKIVTSCPTSKTEWDAAAKRKNCNIIAQHQNCVSGQKFKYHCVINGLRNKLIEVCAPARIIFGHCVEFNVLGGVIQDQRSAPCEQTSPKCDTIYSSTDAYKYPDCYMLVPKSEAISSTKISITTHRAASDGSDLLFAQLICIAAVVLLLVLMAFSSVVFNLCFEKRRHMTRKKMDEGKEVMLIEDHIEQEAKVKRSYELRTTYSA